MNGYKHILLATDFSELSKVAVRRGEGEARAHRARLSLLHVVEHFPVVVPEHWVPPEDIDPATYYRTQATYELDRIAHELGCTDAAREVVVTASSAGHAIAEFAARYEVDLIVVGIHGSWAVGMLGSTAVAVARQAQCDVLLVR